MRPICLILFALTHMACSAPTTRHNDPSSALQSHTQAPDEREVIAPSSGRRLATSGHGFCQILSTGHIRCRELTGFSPIPVASTPPSGGDFTTIAATRERYCALSSGGELSCWRSITDSAALNLDIPSVRYVDVVSDGDHFYALDDSGMLYLLHEPASSSSKEVRANRIEGGPYQRIFAMHQSFGVGAVDEDAMIFAVPDTSDNIYITRKAGSWAKALKSQQTWCGLSREGIVHCSTPTNKSFSPLAPFHGRYHDRLVNRFDVTCARRMAEQTWLCDRDDILVPDEPMKEVVITAGEGRKLQLAGITPDGRLIAPLFAPPARHDFVEIQNDNGLCALRADDTVYCNSENFSYDDDLLRRPGLTFEHTHDDHVMTNHGRIGLLRPSSDKEEREDVLIHGHKKIEPLTAAQEKEKFVDVQHGNDFSCGLRASGEVKCWGSIMGSSSKIKPPKKKMSSIALGGVFACGITKEEGKILCWGDDYYAFLTHAPTDEPGYDALRTSYLSICAHRSDDTVKCWGQGFWETFTLPVKTSNYGMFNGGVCAVPSPEEGMTCWGAGVRWN